MSGLKLVCWIKFQQRWVFPRPLRLDQNPGAYEKLEMLGYLLGSRGHRAVGVARNTLAASNRPNIMLMVSDDFDYGEVGVYGGTWPLGIGMLCSRRLSISDDPQINLRSSRTCRIKLKYKPSFEPIKQYPTEGRSSDRWSNIASTHRRAPLKKYLENRMKTESSLAPRHGLHRTRPQNAGVKSLRAEYRI